MEYLASVSQVLVGFTILNVWLLQSTKATEWRGGAARTLGEEFEAYGLGRPAMVIVGFFKVLLAILLLAGIWIAPLTKPAAVGMAIFMLGAVSMHMRIGDPFKKSLPALSMFIMALVAALFSKVS